ncbi:MAG: hypothetical protein HYS38_00210 [Acidobacteria bacterium]|nr:hypothetical protein [Acidobacteriota bacterium]
MAETGQYIFTFKEVVEALLKKQGIHDGIWGLYVKFGIKAVNIGESDESIRPSAIIPILEMGLQKFEKDTNLSVDASKVNPAPQAAARKGK